MLLRTSQNLQGKEILIISGNFILKLRNPGIFLKFPNNIRDVLEKSKGFSALGFWWKYFLLSSGLFISGNGFGGSLESWNLSKPGMLWGDENPWIGCRWMIKMGV